MIDRLPTMRNEIAVALRVIGGEVFGGVVRATDVQ
jgi:hypothetical protein